MLDHFIQKNRPLLIIGTLFFVFGFVTWLSSVLIPYLQIACELNNFQSYLVAFAFYISYFVMAIPAGILLKIIGYKNGISAGLLVMALGSLLFIPAAHTRIYSLFLLGLFVQGTGLAILQTASNPYVTILGPLESAAKRISIMGICSGIAGIIAPIILGAVILDNVDVIQHELITVTRSQKLVILQQLAHKVIWPYVLISMLSIALSLLAYYSGLPEIDAEDQNNANSSKTRSNILQYPHLLLGVFALFLYTGVEVVAGNSIITYAISQGIQMSTAKFFTSFTLTGMLVGYVAGIICIPKYVSQQTTLKFSTLLGVLFTLCALGTSGYFSLFFIAMLGLANSLMWPSIWPLAINELGRFTKTGSSLLVMAIAGGAIIPVLYGRLTDISSAKLAYWLVVPCYLFIGYYAVYGHKVGLKKVKI